MTISESIKARRSVRSFNGKDLSADDIELIKDFCNDADNPYGIPVRWKILNAKEHGLSSPVISGADTYIAGKMGKTQHAEEAFGFSFEKIILKARSKGIGTTWIAGTMNRAAFEKAMYLNENEVMPCVSPLGYPAEKMSLRETVMRKGVKADSRKSPSELFFSDSFNTPLKPEDCENIRDILEAVRLAPSAVNKQPWRIVICGNKAHFYEKRSKGYISADGWDLQKIDIGIALCHFKLVSDESGFETEFSIDDPNLNKDIDTEYIATYTFNKV